METIATYIIIYKCFDVVLPLFNWKRGTFLEAPEFQAMIIAIDCL